MTIIANLNGSEYIVTAADAEVLFGIFSRAQSVYTEYQDGRYYRPETDRGSLGIEFTNCPVLSTEEHLARVAAKKAKEKPADGVLS